MLFFFCIPQFTEDDYSKIIEIKDLYLNEKTLLLQMILTNKNTVGYFPLKKNKQKKLCACTYL